MSGYAIGSGGICKLARIAPSQDENREWSVPIEAGAGALLGGAGAAGLASLAEGVNLHRMMADADVRAGVKALGDKASPYKVLVDKGTREKLMEGLSEAGKKRIARAANISKWIHRAHLPLAGLGVAVGAGLAAKNAVGHNESVLPQE